MKRDMNLIREILMWAESQEHGYTGGNPDIEGYSDEEVAYHVYLMSQAGLANAIDTGSIDSESPCALLLSLTWTGHEFLDAAKDDTIWTKAKETILKPGVSMTFNFLIEWLKTEAKTKLGFP
jgi:Hypothetical protein (DUF2513)